MAALHDPAMSINKWLLPSSVDIAEWSSGHWR